GALGCAYRKRTQATGPDLRHRRRDGNDEKRHVARHRRGDGRTAAAVRHVHHVELELELQELARHVARRADADGGVVDFVRMRLHEGDEVREALVRCAGVYGEELRQRGDLGYGAEIPFSVEGQAAVDGRVDRVR